MNKTPTGLSKYIKWPAIILGSLGLGAGVYKGVEKATDGEITDSKPVTGMVVNKNWTSHTTYMKGRPYGTINIYKLTLSNGETSTVTLEIYNSVSEGRVYTFETYRLDGEFKIGYCREATSAEYKQYKNSEVDKSTSMNTSEDLPAITGEFNFIEKEFARREQTSTRYKA